MRIQPLTGAGARVIAVKKVGYKKTTDNRNRRTFGVGLSTTTSCVEYCNTHCKCNSRSENQKSPQTRSTKSTRSCYDYNAGNIPVPSTKNTQTSSTAPLLVSSGSNSGTSTPEPVDSPPLSQVNTGRIERVVHKWTNSWSSSCHSRRVALSVGQRGERGTETLLK